MTVDLPSFQRAPTAFRSKTLISDPIDGDWRQELRMAIGSLEELASHISLTVEERAGVERALRAGLPLRITPYYLSLIDKHDPACPIRRQAIPHVDEDSTVPGDMLDPLGEEPREHVPGLVHRYPDRALLIATDHCSMYCRFCTRARLVGSGEGAMRPDALEDAARYLEAHAEVKDVIVSGGDPLTLSTDRLVRIVTRLRAVPSVEVIRLATRVPVTLPQRVSDELVEALKPHHPLWIMTHFNHPKELTPEAQRAVSRLVDAGFPVMNQTVLLQGINDRTETLETLFRTLVRWRAKPYYLLQMDPVQGSRRFRTPLSKGPELIASLEGRLSGIAIPKFIVDTPGGHGKVNVTRQRIVRQTGARTTLEAPTGCEIDYVDADAGDGT